MNTASLELCKELYELSGWESEGWLWTNGPYPAEESFVSNADRPKYMHGDTFIPAYDVGYLCEKLLEAGSFSVRYVSPEDPLSIDLKEWYGKFIAFTPDMKQKDYLVDGLPANALCLLAAELWNQGILHD